MKHNFRIIIGMLLFAIPLCLNAQVKPAKPKGNNPKPKIESPVKPEKPEKPQKPEKPEKKERKGGIEMPRISGFVQGMYQADLGLVGDSANKNLELLDNTFTLRRVRLSVEGNLTKGLSYKIQGDFINSPMLVDAYLKYKACDEFAIQVGQFKTPFSLESPINPVNLEIFDYGEAIKGLVGYNDVCSVGGLGRDIGMMATGNLFPIKGEEGIKYHVVNYSLGVFNGNGPFSLKKNEKGIDNNNRKDLVGRLEVHPGLKDLTLSGSYYYGMYKSNNDATSVAEGETNFGHGIRNRWSAGFQFNDGTFVVRSEYISGQTGYQAGCINDLGNPWTEDRVLKSNGFYAEGGYNFLLGKDKSQKLMPVIRYEHFAKDLTNEDNINYYYTIGLSYWPIKLLNFKLDYSLIQTGDEINSHRVVGMVNFKF